VREPFELSGERFINRRYRVLRRKLRVFRRIDQNAGFAVRSIEMLR
jgi:hypothetical protein